MSRSRKPLRLLMAGLSLLAVLAAPPTASAFGPLACVRYAQPLHRLQAPGGGELLSRTATPTAAALDAGFTLRQGVLARVSRTAERGTSGIWRLRKESGYAYAADGRQLDELVRQGFRKEAVDFYAPTRPRRCLTPVYRFQRSGVQRLATRRDGAQLIAAGWSRGSVAFYARPQPVRATAPVPVEDSRFSLAVLPDTQRESVSAADPRFADRTQWLVRNKDALDLRYALQVGDLVDWGHVDPSQLRRVSDQLGVLETAMPWVGAVGNHDTAAVCKGGSACPGADTRAALRDTTAYSSVFPVSRFPNINGSFEPGQVANSFHTFGAGGVQWLVLAIEMWPRPEVVTWARSVVERNPRHNVIVLTHAYLNGDGTIALKSGGYGSTSPTYLFDNLISVYPNVRMVLSGHVGVAASRVDVGRHGNRILSMLQTFHSESNPVRIVEVDTGQGTITSTVYAPLGGRRYPELATSTSGLSFVR